MLRGLEGRRVAVFFPSDDDVVERRAAAVIRALEEAGARIHVLRAEGSDDDWHGGLYAALVIVGDGTAFAGEQRHVQLAREFLVSDKPLAAFGGGLTVLLEAGGAAGHAVAAAGEVKSAVEKAGGTAVDEPISVDDALITASSSADVEAFAKRVVQEFSDRLEERELDEMSELSFPASDPPAVSPMSIGRAGHGRDSDART